MSFSHVGPEFRGGLYILLFFACEFTFLYHLVSYPRTYVLCIKLGEGEWQAKVKISCVEAYEYAAVTVVGLYWGLYIGWRARVNGPFSWFKDRKFVNGVFSCKPCKEEPGFLFICVVY